MIRPVLFAIVLAGAAAAETLPATLYDDSVTVGAARIRTLEIPLPVEPARVQCSFEVVRGGSGVRAVLLRREEAERWLRGEAHSVEASTAYTRRGAFSHRTTDPDQYMLILDNRLDARTPAEVHLLVRLLPAGPSGPILPAHRRRGEILVWASLTLFAGAAVFSGASLRRRLRRR